MVKGISRQVIVVDTPDPKLFEQAIFILKEGSPIVTDDVILKEASRLVRNVTVTKKPKQLVIGPIWAAGGALLIGSIWLLTVMF